MKKIANLIDTLLSLVFVPECAMCKERLDVADDVFCPHCRSSWERAKQQKCRICGLPMYRCRCVNNRMHMYDIEKLVKLGKYLPDRSEQIMNRVVFKIKRSNNRRLHCFVAAQLSASLRNALGDTGNFIVTYAPRRESEIKRFGYDQAKELARLVARELNAQFMTVFTISAYAREQKKLSAPERLRNAEISFSIANNVGIAGRSVIIVDDVTTTGATLGRCAQLLNIIGADTIIGAVVAAGEL